MTFSCGDRSSLLIVLSPVKVILIYLTISFFSDNILDMRTAIKSKMLSNNKTCCICNGTNNLEVHHVQPVSIGGTNGFANLMVLCKSCHRLKTNSFKKMTGSWIKTVIRKEMLKRKYPEEFIEYYIRQLHYVHFVS